MATHESDAPSGSVDQTKEKGKELVSKAQEQVQEKTSELRSEAEFRFRDQVDQRSTQAGEQIVAIAHALERGSEQLRTEGKDAPARAVEQAARKVEELGGYLRGADADRILGDVEGFARRRPWLTAATGALAGFLASRFLKASSERRYESYGYPPSSEYARRLSAGGV
jgi:vacuolar-type H+-ATPase subunit H